MQLNQIVIYKKVKYVLLELVIRIIFKIVLTISTCLKCYPLVAYPIRTLSYCRNKRRKREVKSYPTIKVQLLQSYCVFSHFDCLIFVCFNLMVYLMMLNLNHGSSFDSFAFLICS